MTAVLSLVVCALFFMVAMAPIVARHFVPPSPYKVFCDEYSEVGDSYSRDELQLTLKVFDKVSEGSLWVRHPGARQFTEARAFADDVRQRLNNYRR
jgi:hypothetical protein